jgi:UDP-glucose 4-epimerase
MNVLVTGGAGFVGTNLIKKLLKAGHCVVSLDDYSTGYIENHIEGCTYHNYSIEDIDGHESFASNKYDLIYHLAGLSRIQPSFNNPTQTFAVNTSGTQRVLELARKLQVKVVYAGSSSKHHDPYQSPYATFKYLGEEICKMYKKTYDMDIEICRFYNVYGPHEVTDGDWAAVIGIWRTQIKNNLPLTIVGDGEQKRDFTHVDDIVAGLMKVGFSEHKHEDAWELGCGRNYSINQVANWFVEYGGGTKKYIEDQPGNYRETLRESDEALEILGWQPQDRLENYIKSLYDLKD